MPDEQNLEAQQPEDNQERPDWLPDNFNSPEDLAKSYGELQGEFTRTRQQLRAQQDQLEQFVAQQQQQEEPEQSPEFIQASQDQLYAAYEQDPVATMAWLANQAAQSVVSQNAKQNQPDQAMLESQAFVSGKYAEDQVTARYNDFDQYKDKITEEITSNPDLYPEEMFKTPIGIERALTRAYKTVRYDSLESDTNQTAEQAFAAQRQNKIQSQTLSGQSGRPAPTDSAEDRWAEIANAGTISFRDIVGGT